MLIFGKYDVIASIFETGVNRASPVTDNKHAAPLEVHSDVAMWGKLEPVGEGRSLPIITSCDQLNSIKGIKQTLSFTWEFYLKVPRSLFRPHTGTSVCPCHLPRHNCQTFLSVHQRLKVLFVSSRLLQVRGEKKRETHFLLMILPPLWTAGT